MWGELFLLCDFFFLFVDLEYLNLVFNMIDFEFCSVCKFYGVGFVNVIDF